jgi:hypothetical protein
MAGSSDASSLSTVPFVAGQETQTVMQAFVRKIALLYPSVQKWNSNETQGSTDEHINHQRGTRIMPTASVFFKITDSCAKQHVNGAKFTPTCRIM